MTLQQLKYIVAVAECGTISDAAAKMYVTQPSLTKAIKEFEKEMGVIIFQRTNRGIYVTNDGEELLGYARQILDQTALMEERYGQITTRENRFSVSCQHYSFAVDAFADVIRRFDSDQYDFTMRETQTREIIDDVSRLKSEIGVLYLSSRNEDVITKTLKKNNLVFEELFTARPHVFISKLHPLSGNDSIHLKELDPYPYLSFEQGDFNSFYYSEEILSVLERPKNIKVRDRATLFNLVIGLNGYTVSSGVLNTEFNGENIIARPLILDDREYMRIGTIRRKDMVLSRYADAYMEALKKHTRQE